MKFELGTLFAASFIYLGLLFLIAYAAERGWFPSRMVRHPLTYVLSLGVYATTWTYYGSVGFAQSQGYNFLTIYLGVTLAFLLTPVLLHPLLRLVREYQLTSVADLFAFRYRSQWTGILVTLFMLVGMLPYISLQIKGVTGSVQVLTQETPSNLLALGFCATLTLFAILFGARHISPREKHEGLVLAIAFESVVKLLALVTVGVFALFGVFGGTSGLQTWVEAHPEAVTQLYEPVRGSFWPTLLLLAFAAAFLLPRQFHMTFTENIEPGTLKVASWGFPLFLLVLNLPIPLILWAGQALSLSQPADFYVLGTALHSEAPALLAIFTFIGGVSAASAMVIVSTLALSSMCLNHILVPASYPDPALNLYRWLLWGRRLLIALIIMAGYGFYVLLEHNQGLVELGLISFVAVAQFLPGIVGVLYWRRATRTGFALGLLAGITVWAVVLIGPLLEQSGAIEAAWDFRALGEPLGLEDKWSFVTFASLSLNALCFAVFSLLTRPSPEEMRAAEACCAETLVPPAGVVALQSPEQFREQLARVLGEETASREVSQALQDLRMPVDETRPAELRLLRDRIERNLSGLLGPQMAHVIVNRRIGLAPGTQTALADTMRYFDRRLEESRSRLQGLAAELDRLRRYHRRVLHELPLGVCSVSVGHEIVIWNTAMGVITGLEERTVSGRRLEELPEPWAGMLRGFLRGTEDHLYKLQITVATRNRWFNLHKSAIDPRGREASRRTGEELGGTVILIEDLTELHNLESEVAHSDRLASIGRLAAGVAHEIGNPLTGIASLTQNLPFEHDPKELEAAVGRILEQTQRIDSIVQSLISFSHAGTPAAKPEPVDLKRCVDEAIVLVQLGKRARQVQCNNEVAAGTRVPGDYQRLIQVFVNLLSNAVDASQTGDRVTVRAREQLRGVTIEVEDQGTGIPPELREQIFEPFVTSKPPGQGTGLGLAMVYSIVEDHAGSIFVQDVPEGGTRFVITLPALTEPAEA